MSYSSLNSSGSPTTIGIIFLASLQHDRLCCYSYKATIHVSCLENYTFNIMLKAITVLTGKKMINSSI